MTNDQASMELRTDGPQPQLVVRVPASEAPMEYCFTLPPAHAVSLIRRLAEYPAIAQGMMAEARRLAQAREVNDAEFCRAAGITAGESPK